MHKHKCSCGQVWEHSDSCAGNTEAHTCPNCGEEVWYRYEGKCKPTTKTNPRFDNPYLFFIP